MWVLTPALSKPLPQRELREEPVSSVPVGPAVLLKTVLPVELWKNQTLIIYAIKYQKPIYPYMLNSDKTSNKEVNNVKREETLGGI